MEGWISCGGNVGRSLLDGLWRWRWPGLGMAVMLAAGLPTGAIAQPSSDECYMVQANGQVLDLGYLCTNTGAPLPRAMRINAFQVPIKRRESGIPVIDVTFNGRHTFEMMLDTGASNTVITPRMASQLQVKPVGVARVDTASQVGLEIPVGVVSSIAVGGVQVADVPVAIAGPVLDTGLLGQDFFGGYDLTIRQDRIEFQAR